MSQEDFQVIGMCDRNQKQRKHAEAVELKQEMRRMAEAADRRAEKRRIRYRTVMPTMFFGGGMSAVVGAWLYWWYQQSLACILAFVLMAVLVGYGFHFDQQSRK